MDVASKMMEFALKLMDFVARQVETPGSGAGGGSASGSSAWGGMFGGEAAAADTGAEGEGGEDSSMLGSTRNMLSGSMKSMGIGGKKDDSALTVGRGAV